MRLCDRCGAEHPTDDTLFRPLDDDSLVVCLSRIMCDRTIEQAREDAGMDRRYRFNERDVGGAFDGFQVTSDADPGL